MNAWIRPSLMRCSSSSTAPNSPSSDSISDSIACGFDGSSVASRSCIAAASIFNVERKSVSSSREPQVRPRSRELEAVRHLVDRDVRPEVRGVERPVAFELRDVRHDEQERVMSGPGDRDVVLPHHVLSERTEHRAHLRAQEQRGELLEHPAHGPHLLGDVRAERFTGGLAHRRRHPRGGGLDQIPEALGVRVDPVGTTHGTDLDHVGGRLKPGEAGDVHLGHAHRLLEATAVLVGGRRGRRGPPARSRCRSGGPAPSSPGPPRTT